MNLSIVIPRSPNDFFTSISTCISPLKSNKVPFVPKKENINKIFNWGEYDNQELYSSTEEMITTFENSFYKQYFPNNTRILIKNEIENNFKKLYILIKKDNKWLGSTIFINNNEHEKIYYDYKYKNILNMFY
jgi:hypothetical protein